MLELVYTKQFKKDYKRVVKRRSNVEKLFEVINFLQNEIPLPPEKKTIRLQETTKAIESVTSNRIFFLYIK